MDLTYDIVKVYVTERSDVCKRHSNVITIWRTSAIEVTALLKKKDPRDARQWSSGQIFLSTPHTNDRSLYNKMVRISRKEVIVEGNGYAW